MAIDFRVRDFFYPADILRLRRQFERHQTMSRSELEEHKVGRLRAVVADAVQHVPYYERLFREHGVAPDSIQSCDDLEAIPVLTRDHLLHHGPELRARNAARCHPVNQRTGGTTGPPIEFMADRYSQSLEFVYYWRHWSWAGYRLGDRFAELGSQHFLTRKDVSATHWQPHLRRLMLDSSQLSASTAPELARAIRKHRPRFLKGMPSAVHFLARSLEDAGIADIRFQAVFTNGELVTPHYRQSIESVFGCPVLDSYGHMERTVAISQCLEGGYHIIEDYGLLQFSDPRPGETEETVIARAIGTSLHNRAMPLIRYDIGDEIELFREPRSCPCGRSFPLVKGILGRTRDVLITPDGRRITSMFVLPEMVNGVLFMQLSHESPEEVTLKIVPDSQWNASEQERLLTYAKRLLGDQMQIRVETVARQDVIEKSGKLPPVLSRV